jgi:hypothetical protein
MFAIAGFVHLQLLHPNNVCILQVADLAKTCFSNFACQGDAIAPVDCLLLAPEFQPDQTHKGLFDYMHFVLSI